MATEYIINGSDYRLQVSTDDGVTYDEVADVTQLRLSRQVQTRDVSTKRTGNMKRIKDSMGTAQASGDVLVSYNAEAGFAKTNDLQTLSKDRTLAKWKITNEVSGDMEYDFDGILTEFEKSSGIQDNVQASITIEIDDDFTETAIT